jgi:hypothetical protein
MNTHALWSSAISDPSGVVYRDVWWTPLGCCHLAYRFLCSGPLNFHYWNKTLSSCWYETLVGSLKPLHDWTHSDKNMILESPVNSMDDTIKPFNPWLLTPVWFFDSRHTQVQTLDQSQHLQFVASRSWNKHLLPLHLCIRSGLWILLSLSLSLSLYLHGHWHDKGQFKIISEIVAENAKQ